MKEIFANHVYNKNSSHVATTSSIETKETTISYNNDTISTHSIIVQEDAGNRSTSQE